MNSQVNLILIIKFFLFLLLYLSRRVNLTRLDLKEDNKNKTKMYLSFKNKNEKLFVVQFFLKHNK